MIYAAGMAAFIAENSPAVRNPISETRLTARFVRHEGRHENRFIMLFAVRPARQKIVMALRPSRTSAERKASLWTAKSAVQRILTVPAFVCLGQAQRAVHFSYSSLLPISDVRHPISGSLLPYHRLYILILFYQILIFRYIHYIYVRHLVSVDQVPVLQLQQISGQQ